MRCRPKLADLDPRLESLIAKARDLVETLRGDGLISADDAQIALENLNLIQTGMQSLNTEAQEFARRINESIADGLTSAISDFARGMTSAQDAARTFFADLLRYIAETTIRMQILQALGGSGGNGFISGISRWSGRRQSLNLLVRRTPGLWKPARQAPAR